MGFVIDNQGNYLPVLGESSTLDNKADIDFSNISSTAKEVISTNAMPSANYDLVQAGASGTWYTAPANGWYFVNFSTGSGGGDYSRVDWEDGMWLAKNIAGALMNVSWMIPIRKGAKIQLTFGSNAGISSFRFYYC